MYDKSILAKSTGASLGVVAVVGLLFMSTGTAFAMPVAGIGGFTIQADEITGEGLVLYPGSSSAENTTNVNDGALNDQYPSGVIELDQTTINGLQLQKVFDLENKTTLQGTTLMPGKARLNIVSGGEVTSDTLMLKAQQIGTNGTAEFSGLTITENTVEGPQDVTSWLVLRSSENASDYRNPIDDTNFSASVKGNERKKSYDGASQPGLYLEQPFIRATYLATDSITIPELRLEVQYDPDNDGDYEWAS